jgi:hypothetical protein
MQVRASSRLLGLLLLLVTESMLFAPTRSFASSGLPTTDPSPGDAASPRWHAGFHLPGLDGPVRALLSWRGQLIAGGDFEFADGQPAPGLAAWDGARWSAIDPTHTGRVTAATVWKNGLVVARGGPNVTAVVAWWDGADWTTLPTRWGTVEVLLAQGDSLLAGGSLVEYRQLNQVTPNLIRWTGSAWEDVLPIRSFDGPILALAEHEGGLAFAGEFYGADGGYLGGVANWNGRSVETIGTGLSGGNTSPGPRALAVVEGKLVLGGRLVLRDGWTKAGVVCFDSGHWKDWGGGFARVDGLWSDESGLLACGLASDGKTIRVARRHGRSWIDLTPRGNLLTAGLDRLRLTVLEDRVFVAGTMGTSSGPAISYAAFLERETWAPLEAQPGLGLNGMVQFLEPWNGGLIAAGKFERAGAVAAYHVANFDGQEWAPFGEGPPGQVMQLVSTDQGPAVSILDNDNYRRPVQIRLWSNAVWNDLTEELGRRPDLSAIGAYRGEVVAAGQFRLTGRADTTTIAIYHEGHWQPLQDQGWIGIPQLVKFDGELVVYGQRRASELGTPEVLRLTGRGWVKFLPPPPHPPFRIVRWGALYAAGCRYLEWNYDHYLEHSMVYAWDGGRWTQLGSQQPWLRDLVAYSDSLYVATGGNPSLSRWDGSVWAPMAGAPVSGDPRRMMTEALSVSDGNLWVGGQFSSAGSYAACNIARYGPESSGEARKTALHVAARPNPFSDETAILFELARPLQTQVTIHAVDGRRLRTLWDGVSGPGPRMIWWDGRDAGGHALPAGTYWARAATPLGDESARIVIIR